MLNTIDLTMKEVTIFQTTHQLETISIYLSYWKEHILTLKEDLFRVQYAEILTDVMSSHYGSLAGIELCFRMLQRLEELERERTSR